MTSPSGFRMGQRKRTAPVAGARPTKSRRQQTLSQAGVSTLRHLKEPRAACGDTVSVPGSFWTWPNDAAGKEALAKDYECIVLDFDSLHRPSTQEAPSAVFKCQDPDDSADGSRRSFCIKYPSPFLKFWYRTHEQEGTQSGNRAESLSSGPSGSSDDDGDSSDDDGDGCQHLVKRAKGVYKYLKHKRTERVQSGKKAGKKARIYSCQVCLLCLLCIHFFIWLCLQGG